MINTNDNHMIIKNSFGKKNDGKYTLVNIPIVITLFFPIHRKEYDFMELWFVSRKGNNFKVI